MSNPVMNFESLPDITPAEVGQTAVGRCYAFEEWEARGYPYLTIALIQADGSLAKVKINKQTFERAALRQSSYAFGHGIEEACSLGLCIQLSRSPNPKGQAPYWNVDKASADLEHTIPQLPSEIPAPPTALPTAPQSVPPTTHTPLAASDLDARYERYMQLAARVLADNRLTDVAVNFDVNAAVFTILKGGW